MPYKDGSWGEKAKARSKQRNEYFRSRRYQDENLKKRYGITASEYEAMCERQKNLCAICGKPEKSKSYNNRVGAPQKLAIDHCHTTGKVRGLLCFSCNRGLGYLKDSIPLLRSAIKYLS